jgi:hypothetical protein
MFESHMFERHGQKGEPAGMRTKLTRIALMSLMLVLPAPLCGALAAASEIDQKVLEARQKSPALSFVVMEAKLFEGDSTTEMSCSTIRMVIKSEDGKLTNVRTKELLLFDRANNESWVKNLEMTGPENVRARLAQNAGYGPGAAIPIGMVQSMSIGFAEHWLAWHDQQKSERENAFRSRQIFWTRTAAISAATAAAAGVMGWIWTIATKHP